MLGKGSFSPRGKVGPVLMIVGKECISKPRERERERQASSTARGDKIGTHPGRGELGDPGALRECHC